MLKRCFASFFIACLVFSVSVLPCFANPSQSGEVSLTVSVGDRDSSMAGYNFVTYPSTGRETFYEVSSGVPTFRQQPLSFTSGVYEPVDYDRTLYVGVGLQNDTAGYDSWFNNVNEYANKPSVIWSDSRDSWEADGFKTYPNGVNVGNDIYNMFGEAGEIFSFRVTIPAYSNSFQFSTSNFVVFTTQVSPWKLVSYGGYIINSADSDVLALIEQLLAKTSSIDVNVGNLVTALNEILANSNASLEILEALQTSVDSYLPMLEVISNNTTAIYALLSDALQEESEQLTENAQQAAQNIQESARQEAIYQEYMTQSYEAIDLEGFDFGLMYAPLQVVGGIFTDMFNAFGDYKIVFTFPLFLGLALLVLGRISRTGGGNSSRNVEHKGGEGGA